MVIHLGDDFSSDFQQQSLNYKIIYLRRFNSTVIAMRKIGLARRSVSYPICDTPVEVLQLSFYKDQEIFTNCCCKFKISSTTLQIKLHVI